MSTIAAVSTPNAVGGIAVIRISGDKAIDIAAKVFKPAGGKCVADMAGYTCAYGYAHDGGERIDDCILTVFRAPHSYTGEDTAEISCHGGLYVSKRILRALLKNGAENAEGGEFTKRAYLNGKLDLTQAEAVMDIISAKGETELKIAEALREGAAFRKAKKCSDKLMKILGDLAAWADYPEEDIPEVEPDALMAELKEVRGELSTLVENYDSGRILREGIATAIIGRPNVGKSTLFNCLSGCDRSIVTDIAGTTRDIVEETVRIGDLTLRLSDTAGIHETDDIILVIAVFDGSCPLTADDLKLIEKTKNKKCIAVVNKNDVSQQLDVKGLSKYFIHIVYISAKENSGVEALEKEINDIFSINEHTFDNVSAANERQKRCIDNALSSLDEDCIST